MTRLGAVAAGLMMLAFASAAAAQEVRVTLSDVEPRTGKILVSLQTQGEFMQGRGSYSTMADAPAARGTIVVVFNDVAPGDYAMMAMHDENGDFQMRSAPNGMPLEGWAMSNGGALTGAPTFDVLKFSVGGAAVELAEPMFYPYVPPGQ